MAKRYLVKFYWDCYRRGKVDGVFIATQEEVIKQFGKTVYFGEILGKHSDVYGELEEGDFGFADIGEEALVKLEVEFGTTISGYNPLHYIEERESNYVDNF